MGTVSSSEESFLSEKKKACGVCAKSCEITKPVVESLFRIYYF